MQRREVLTLKVRVQRREVLTLKIRMKRRERMGVKEKESFVLNIIAEKFKSPD